MARRAAQRALILAAGLSGAAALVHELMWVRLLGHVFGHTLYAVQSVLTVFFAGLALGSWAVGVLPRRRPLRLYAWLEIAIAGWAALFLIAVPHVTQLYDRVAPLATETLPAVLARLMLTAALVLPAAAAMGATFPLLAAALSSAERSAVAQVYAVNTLGGACGAWLGVYVALPALGLVATVLLAALAGLAAAAIAWPQSSASVPDSGAQASGKPLPALRRGVALALFFTGLSGLGLEFLWTRALEQVLSGTVYTFATILTVFLVGIAAGSALFERSRRLARAPVAVFGLLVASSALLLASPAVVAVLPRLHALLGAGLRSSPLLGNAAESAVAMVLLLPATLAFGLSFPALFALGADARDARAVGRLSAVNTAGGLLGPLVAAQLALPALDLCDAIVALALPAVAASVACAAALRRWSLAAVAIAPLALLAALPSTLHTPLEPGERYLAHVDGPAATVAVVERGDEVFLRVNDSYSLGGGHGVFSEKRQGHIAMLLHPDPRRVLVLGVGTGNTLGAVALHEPQRLVAVELLAPVLALAREHYADSNRAVLDDPRVQVVTADAARVVRSLEEPFDLVIGDLFHPWQAGVGELYSREHFAAVLERLDARGVFVQWLPLYQLSLADLSCIARTFAAVFPEVQLWLGNFGATTPIAALAGSRVSMALQESGLQRALGRPEVARELAEVYLDHETERLGSFVGGRARVLELGGEGPLNTRLRPRVEYSAARALLDEALGREKLEALQALVQLHQRQDHEERAAGQRDPSYFARRACVRATIVAQVAAELGDWEQAAECAEIAVRESGDYDVARRVASHVGSLALAADRAAAERVFRALLAADPADEAARAGLEAAAPGARATVLDGDWR